MKKTALLLLSLALVGAGTGAGLMMRPAKTALADTPMPNTQIELEQTDYNGNKVKVPVYYDGFTYILADYTRNIYVYDARTATSATDLQNTMLGGYLPEYTSESGVFEDKMAISIYATAVNSYDYFTEENVGKLWKGVNGKDNDSPWDWSTNNEVPLYVFVHTNFYGLIDNAMYSKGANSSGTTFGYMAVGDGYDYGTLKNQGKAVDVIAHEYQHGISWAMNNDRLAIDGGLGTIGYVGALNEAISDIFGMLIEGKDINDPESGFWTIGEDNEGGYGDGTLRSIKNPGSIKYNYSSIGYPATVDEAVDCGKNHGINHDATCDNGMVHFHSTIFSHFQYTAWELFPEYFTPQRIGKLWFEFLDLMTKEVQGNLIDENCFAVFAKDMMQAAKNVNFEAEGQEAIRYALVKNGFPVEGYDKNDVFYTVTFLDDDNETVLGRSFVRKGETAAAPEHTKAPTDKIRYELIGWSASLENVTADFSVKASYKEIARVRIKYIDADGNVLHEGYKDEESDVEPEITLPEDTVEFEYSFKWEENTNADGSITRKAVIESAKKKYKVTFVTGTERNEQTLEYGSQLPPARDGFKGWYLDEDFTTAATTVTGEMTVYAKQSSSVTPLPPAPDTDTPSDFPTGLVVGICVGVVVLAAAAAVVIVLLKKKKN